MTLMTPEILNALCPLHVSIDASGVVRHAGPTFEKLVAGRAKGAHLFDLVEVERPRSFASVEKLFLHPGRKLYLQMRNPMRTSLKGQVVLTGCGGAIINLSFGKSLIDAVRDYALTSTDFPPTDMIGDMLYLYEAKTMAMSASNHTNKRLQGAKMEAEAQAYTDVLTGLRNRRALDHAAERISQEGDPFAVLQMDLDKFKFVNDRYGHGAGDHVLQVVAGILMDRMRKTDMAVRLGGDEFAILMCGNIPARRLDVLGTALIKAIEEPILYQETPLSLSASIGISICQKGDCNVARHLEKADAALYAAKRGGRGCFRFYEPDMEEILR